MSEQNGTFDVVLVATKRDTISPLYGSITDKGRDIIKDIFEGKHITSKSDIISNGNLLDILEDRWNEFSLSHKRELASFVMSSDIPCETNEDKINTALFIIKQQYMNLFDSDGSWGILYKVMHDFNLVKKLSDFTDILIKKQMIFLSESKKSKFINAVKKYISRNFEKIPCRAWSNNLRKELIEKCIDPKNGGKLTAFEDCCTIIRAFAEKGVISANYAKNVT